MPRFAELEEALGLARFEDFESRPPEQTQFLRGVLLNLEPLRAHRRPQRTFDTSFEVWAAARAEFGNFIAACAEVGNGHRAINFAVAITTHAGFPHGFPPELCDDRY